MDHNIFTSNAHNDSEHKRINAVKKRRQEFKQKQQIIQKALGHIDNLPNKKKTFFDDEVNTSTNIASEHVNINSQKTEHNIPNKILFDEEDVEDTDINFEIKDHFEGEKGHKILDLQSRYKSDKRFILDERFIDEDNLNERDHANTSENGNAEQNSLDPKSEKEVQYNILQDILGVQINHKSSLAKNTKPQLGMVRYDPANPEHAKFLAPVDKTEPQVLPRNKRKNKNKDDQMMEEELPPTKEQPEVSQEKFYKVSETLKDTFTQPKTEGFRLLSMFGEPEEKEENELDDQEGGYVSLEKNKMKRVKNPLDPGEKNPFVYDSSESEAEEADNIIKENPLADGIQNTKAVWKENLFFTQCDDRLKDGMAFFKNFDNLNNQKDRRELKFLMKKRLYNSERKKQMFKNKIGGKRKKSTKKIKRKS